jgi:hypothetical protein
VRIKSEASQVLLSTCLYLSLCAYLSAYMSPQHEVHRPACRSISAISSSHAFIDQPDILLYHIAPSLPFSSLLSFSTSLHSTLSYRIVSYRIVLYLIISYLIRELRPTLLYSNLPLAPSVFTTDRVHHTACIPQGLAGPVSSPPPVLWQSGWGRRRGRRLS